MSDTLKYKLVKTRKDHGCQGCARRFKKGSMLYNIIVVDQCTFSYYYLCEDCHEFIKTIDYSEFQDDFFYGCLLEFEDYKNRIKG